MPDITAGGSAKAVDVQEILERKKSGIPSNIKVVRNATDSLDKNAFLKLLVTELSKQDPLSPVNDREFISQMAQFSSLEQMNNVSKSMNRLNSMSASQLIGMQITGNDFVNGQRVEGIVDTVFYDGESTAFLRVNGRSVRMEDISAIGLPAQTPQSAVKPQESTIPPAARVNVPEQTKTQQTPLKADVSRETPGKGSISGGMRDMEAILPETGGRNPLAGNYINNQTVAEGQGNRVTK